MFGNNIFSFRNRYRTLYIAYTEKTNKLKKKLKILYYLYFQPQ